MNMHSNMDGDSDILKGIRVIDLTTVMMGPYATLQLAQFGADVVKVEALTGDSMRAIGPSKSSQMGPLYLHANRSKRSIALNLKTEDGRKAIHDLIKSADVFVSNIRMKALERLKLDYVTLSAIHPNLIYATANGFGAGGSYEARPAYDDLIQGLSGIPALVAHAAQSNVPRYAPIVLADRVTALALSGAILAALVRKERTGRGSCIEVPMFETMVDLVLSDHLGGRSFDPSAGDFGYQRLLIPYRRPYKTKDGHICVVIYTDEHWRAFLDIVNKGHLFKEDPRFSSLERRSAHIDELYALVADELKGRTTADWDLLLNQADIPTALMHTLESLLEDPHLQDVGFFSSLTYPSEGKVWHMRRPSRWRDEDDVIGRPAPQLGENTREILEEVGYSEGEINELVKKGVIGVLSNSSNTLTS